LEETGVNPPALENKPIFYDWMREYWLAYSLLSSRRSSGECPNPIPLSEIESYIRLYSCTDFELLIRAILAMDEEYFIAYGKKQKADRAKAKAEGGVT